MLGLSFLSPLFLAGALAAAIPIAIHLFYRRTEPVIEFSAMRFLRRAPVEHSRRRRLKELLLLALRVGALVLLAFAFARPYLSQSAAALTAPATIVLLDTSASLSAPGQFDRVRQRAERAIRAAPATHAVAVVTFGNGVDVIAPVSQDRAGALAALPRLKPGAGATGYAPALARAAEALGDRPGRIVLVTDLQQSEWDAADEGGISEQVAVDLEDVGSPAENVAITSIRAEGSQAVAVLRNYSSRVLTQEVVFAIDDRAINAVPVTLPADGTAEVRAVIDGAAVGRLSATVSDREGSAADNVRYLALDPDAAMSVLAVTAYGRPSESFYLERALAIAEGAGGFRFRALSGPGFSRLAADGLDDIDVIVVLGTRGLERRGRELLASYARSGGGLLLTAGPDVEPDVIKDALNEAVRTSWRARDGSALRFAPDDGRHPVFRIFGGVGTLGNVDFQRAALVEAPPNVDIVARYTDGSPALVEEHGGTGRVLVFASDLNRQWNDFPLQPAFVPFVHELMRYLAAARTSQSEYLVGDLPGAGGAVPGVVRLPASDGRTGRRVAVNVDPRESDPTRMTDEAFRAGVARLHASATRQTRERARDDENDQRLWQYALLMMTVALVAEGLLGRRLG